MVVTFFPATLFITVEQERTGCASTCTVQAPQSDIPQPNFVPVSPMTSRRTQSSGISGATSTVRDVPFKVKVMLAIFGVRRMVTGFSRLWAAGWGMSRRLGGRGGRVWLSKAEDAEGTVQHGVTEKRSKRNVFSVPPFLRVEPFPPPPPPAGVYSG